MGTINQVSPIISAIVTAITVVVVGNQLPNDVVVSWGIGINQRLIHFVIVLAISLAICWLIGFTQLYLWPLLVAKFWPEQRRRN